MPFSVLSIIGNCLFSPFLTIFLTVSFLIFFCQLLYIPYDLLARILELISSYWLWCMNCENVSSYTLGFINTSNWILCVIPLTAVIALHYKQVRSHQYQSIILALILLVTIVFLWLPQMNNPSTITIEKLTIFLDKKETLLLDPGYLGSPKMSPSWCQHTLAHELINQTGITHIDTVICLQPSYGALLALEKMIPTFNIKKVYMPFFIPQEGIYRWNAFKKFRQACTLHHTQIIRIYEKPITFELDAQNNLIITPLADTIETPYAQYKAVQVTSTIDNKITHHYSAKYHCKQTTDQSP